MGCAGSLMLRGLFFSCSEQGKLASCSGQGLLTVVATLCGMGSRVCGISSCGSQALKHRL